MLSNDMNFARDAQMTNRSPFPPQTPVGMAYVPFQQFGMVYQPDVAFTQGTIFPDLDKPWLGSKAFSERAAGVEGYSNMPNAAGMGNMPGMANMPNMAGMAGMPPMANTSAAASAPNAANTTGMAAMPTMPTMPHTANTANTSNSAAGTAKTAPNMTRFPSQVEQDNRRNGSGYEGGMKK